MFCLFVDIYHFNHTFLHAHIERRTHKGAQEAGWEGRKKLLLLKRKAVKDKGLAHLHTLKKEGGK